jgi:2-keto-4-pentenoate hydratase/2-oxohepta-3-ene-1,7-dioic acid hydratase in catechol pathway
MKLITFAKTDGEPRLGALDGNRIIDLAAASQGRLPADMRNLLEMGDAGLEMARSAVQSPPADAIQDADSARILAPIRNPSKVVAIGLNYMDHCREQNIEPPKLPTIFTKFPSSIVGPGDAIRWDPALTGQVDYEAELALVIGRTARNVPESAAFDHVAGYTICHDVSARDLQFGDGQWVRGKSLDTFCPLGPTLVTRDEIADPHNLAIRCTVNGQVLQDSNTRELIFKLPYLIAFCSRAFTLLPGDVITTGTPDGVGVFRDPQVFLHDGDQVTVEVEGLGQLTNPCVEERQA